MSCDDGMVEAWQLVISNYSLKAFHSAVPSWQLKLRCVVFVLQGFYRNTIIDNGAGMLPPNYDMNNFLKLKCVLWMWLILHIFLFIPYYYNASTICVWTRAAQMMKYGQSAQGILYLQHTVNMHYQIKK
jgi:hypothetical protein